MKTAIFTGFNDSFSELGFDLIESISANFPDEDGDTTYDVYVFNLGLSDDKVDHLKKYKFIKELINPDWDINISKNIREDRPHLRALTVRPFLKKYAKNYDAYIWIDADAYIQSYRAISVFANSSLRYGAAMCTAQHSQYGIYPRNINFRLSRLLSAYGNGMISEYIANKYYNCGIFALSKDSGIWDAWAHEFQSFLNKNNEKFICDQTPFNFIMWKYKFRHLILPEIYNWSVALSPPSINVGERKFYESGSDGRKLEIVHMVANSHKFIFKLIGEDEKYIPSGISVQYGRKNSLNQLEIPDLKYLQGRWVLE